MKITIKIVLLLVVMLSCTNKKEKRNGIVIEQDISHIVEYEFRSATIDGVNYKPKSWIRRTFKTNKEDIIPLKISDSVTLGVEIVLHEIKWRENKEYVFNVFYYEQDTLGKWRTLSNKPDPVAFYYDCKHIFDSEYSYEDEVFFSVEQSVKIISNESKSKNKTNINSTKNMKKPSK